MGLHPTKVEYSDVERRIICIIRVKLSGVLRKLIRYIKQLKGQIRINPYPYLLRSHYLMLVLNRSIYTFAKDGTHWQGN